MPHVVYRSSFQAFIREKVALSYKLTATVGEFWKWNRNLVDVGKQEMFACVKREKLVWKVAKRIFGAIGVCEHFKEVTPSRFNCASVRVRTQPSNSRRTNLQIYAEILNLCSKPQTKTRITQKTNLPYSTVKKYLKKVQKLIEIHHSQEKYSTPLKGQEFLQIWIELQRFVISEENHHSLNPISLRNVVTPTKIIQFSTPRPCESNMATKTVIIELIIKS